MHGAYGDGDGDGDGDGAVVHGGLWWWSWTTVVHGDSHGDDIGIARIALYSQPVLMYVK